MNKRVLRLVLSMLNDNRKEIMIISFIDFLKNSLSILAIVIVAFIFVDASKRGLFHINSVMSLIILLSLYILLDYLNSKINKWKAIFDSKSKTKMRIDLLERILDLGPSFTSLKRTGDMAQDIWMKIEWSNFIFSMLTPKLISNILLSLLLCIIFFAYSLITPIIIVLVCLVITILLPMFFYSYNKKAGKLEFEESNKYYSDCLDGLEGIETINGNGIQEDFLNKMSEQGNRVKKATMGGVVRTAISSRFIEFIINYEIVFLAIYLFSIKYNYLHKPYILVMIVFALFQLKLVLRMIMGAFIRGQRGLEALTEIAENYYHYNGKTIHSGRINNDESQNCNADDKTILLDNVAFSYIDETNVIKEISLSLSKGVTAFIGESGSGKSTLALLISAFYLPKEGNISVLGLKTNNYDGKAIRNKISAVWQNNYIFNLSFIDNIKISKPNASLDEIKTAAKKAHIHSFISSLPNGYNTIIGEGGMVLSGGQKQRISIARAFLKDAPIFIFDEATSHLDKDTEDIIQECINSLKKNKIVIVIAHNPNTIKRADRICLIKDGRLIDYGTYKDVYKKSSYFRSFLESNAGEVL